MSVLQSEMDEEVMNNHPFRPVTSHFDEVITNYCQTTQIFSMDRRAINDNALSLAPATDFMK